MTQNETANKTKFLIQKIQKLKKAKETLEAA